MDTLYTPKADLYTILQEVDEDTVVYQNRPEVIEEFPCITFSINQNRAEINLGKDIAYQELSATIDIWTLGSAQGSELLSSLESTMRAEGYTLEFSADIPDPDDRVRHITTRFNLVR